MALIIFLFLSFCYSQRLPVYVFALKNLNEYEIFANAGWDGNWYVGYDQCWIKMLPPAPAGVYAKAFIGAKLGRAKTRQKINRPIWEKEAIPGEIYIGISSTPSWRAENRFFLVSTEDIPLEPDPENALRGVGESRWFWAEVPLSLISFDSPNYLCLWSPSGVFARAKETTQAEVVRQSLRKPEKGKKYKIAGKIKDVAGIGVKNIPVIVRSGSFSATAVSDEFGRYEFSVETDVYTVSIGIAGYFSNPERYKYEPLAENYYNEDFEIYTIGPILCGAWSRKQRETSCWLNTDIRGVPPIKPLDSPGIPISVFEPAIGIKLIPKGYEQEISIHLHQESDDGVLNLFADVKGDQIYRCWVETSTDRVNWRKYDRYIYSPPYTFSLFPGDFQKGKFYLRVCANDLFENIGYSTVLELVAE